LLYNSNGIAKLAEEFGHAEPGEKRVSQQHTSTDQILSFQDHRLTGRIIQKGMTHFMKASPFFTENLKVQKLA